jgi:hypothetical protein
MSARDAVIVPGTLLHCLRLGDSIRPEDAAELAAIGAPDSHTALLECHITSEASFAATLDGQVGAMFGCGPVKSVLGAPPGLG